MSDIGLTLSSVARALQGSAFFPMSVTREAVRELIRKKDDLEEEMLAIESQLKATGGVGVKNSLVDAEGFPRADIDVFAVRTLRNRLATLQTDHVALLKQIESGLGQVFGSGQAAKAVPAATETRVPAAAAAPREPRLVPFATVNTVSDDSPAKAAGLFPADRVIQFGDVHAANHNKLQRVAEVVRGSINKPISVTVLRGAKAELVQVQLTPQTWSGQGLLGCHLLPM
eukprot:TRINITY_DN13606_c0_g1_i1.p1 TRINITY_DN13606_c0_g1~~TRINITY_DN13606_c0_g1_i1.p1  ORF type:complete len:237 (-),score=39.32 TRINITY_DN13606_c0_g1_i1:60-743(-)